MTKNIKSKLNYFFAIFSLVVFGLLFLAGSASAISSAFTSRAIDTGQNNVSWGVIKWNTTQPSAATKIELRAKSGSTSTITGIGSCPIIATITSANAIDTTGYSLISSANGVNPTGNTCVVAGDRYLKYEATLTTTDQTVTPSLNSVDVYYNYYPASQTLTSSAYNTLDSGNVLAQISWEQDATLPTGASVKLQVQSAPNNDNGTSGVFTDDLPGSWSGFVGPESGSSCDTGYFTYTPGGAAASNGCGCADDGIQLSGNRKITCTLPTGHSLKTASPADQWLQYKVFLSSTGATTPSFYDFTMVYVINAPPCIGSLSGNDCISSAPTAIQNSDGTVSISYDLSDSDSSSFTVYALVDIGVYLNETLTNSDTTAITLSSTSLLPSSGTIQIGNEQISYTSKHANGTDLNGTITRGANSTLAADHTSGSDTPVWIKGSTFAGGDNIGASQTAGTGKSITWTIKTDLPGVFVAALPTGAKIRVSANDGNAANQVGNGDSAGFVLDTANPAPGSPVVVLIDSTVSSPAANLSISITDDDITKYMRFANAANQTVPDCSADLYAQPDSGATAYQDYATTKAFYPLSPNADGISTICYEFKDSHNNKLQGSASTPAKPVNIKFNDVSNPGSTPAQYKSLVWWTPVAAPLTGDFNRYNIYRSTDNGATYSEYIQLSGDISRNYCFDEADTPTANCDWDGVGNLDNTQSYYYKVRAESSTGYSPFSDAVYGTPDGSTVGEAAADSTAPSLVAPSPAPDSGASSNSVNSATITWATDEAAYSLIRYGKTVSLGSIASGDNFSNTSTEFVTSPHTVNLSNLDAGATYYYQILSADAAGNLLKDPNVADASLTTGNLHSFTTSAPSVVEASPLYVAGIDSAAIYWTTSGAAGTQIRYIASPGDPAGGTSTTLHSPKTTVHYAAIASGLIAGTIYNYQIVLINGDGNEVVYPTAPGTYYTFTTADIGDGATTPVIVNTTSATQPATFASITWTTTGDSSYSIVEYGPTASLGYVAGSVATADFTENHIIALDNLMPGTIYNYKIRSANTYGVLTTSPASGTSTFTTADLSISPAPSPVPSRSGAVITWTTNGLADSRVEYGTTATLSGATFSACPGTNTAGDSCTSWQDATNKVTDHIVSLSSLDPDTTYYYRAISRNGEGTAVASSIGSFETVSGTKPVITFGSAAAPAETSVAITFQSDKLAFLSVIYTPDAACATACATTTATADSSYTGSTGEFTVVAADTPTAITVSGLNSNTTYAYRLRARDLYGNIGRENAIRSFTTDTDDQAPTITFTPASDVSTASSSVTITWTTSDEASNSEVDYGTTLDGSNIPQYELTAVTNANYNIDHSITLTGLTPETTYYYKLTSADNVAPIPNTATRVYVTDGDAASGYLSFTTPIQVDTTVPTITAVSSGTPSSTSATITWTTAGRNSSSLVDFALAADYPNSIFTQGNSSDDTANHSVTLVGLAPGTAYRFRVKSMDTSSKMIATDDNSSAGYLFTTQTAAEAGTLPVITSVQSSGVTSSSAVVAWTTSIASDSTVGYSAGDQTYIYEKGLAATATSHSVTLTNLTPLTEYFFQVKSRNGNELATLSADLTYPTGFTFTTLAGADSVAPDISNIQVASTTSNKSTITWTTNEVSDSFVEFGTVSGIYTSVQGNPSDSVLSHSVQLTSLTPDTQYYFQVRSTDAGGNKAVMVYTAGFRTTTGAAVDCPAQTLCRSSSCPAQEACPAIDTTAPKITNIKISDITFNTAAISWDTDENSNSMVGYDTVSYGIKNSFTYSTGQSKDAIKSHKVILQNLDSDTNYYFKVSSTDSKGNTADGDQQTFKTISITQAKDKGAATAESLKKQFEDIAKTLVKDNLATEQNIKDIISRIAKPPVMGQEGPVVKDIKAYGVTIVWNTDRKANSIVKFTVTDEKNKPLAAGDNWREVGKMDTYDTAHEVSLLGLAPSTSYTFLVFSQDILGNSASSEIKSFTTSSSSSIFNVAITDLGLTAATINWETANLSTSSLEWGLEATYGNYKDKGEEKVKKHSISLDNLSSGTAYHYRVRSVEEGGSILSSDDYTFITPELPQITKYELGEVKDNSIALTWTSNIPIDSNVRYTNKDTNETKVQSKEEKATDHALTILGLEAGKTYAVEIQGRDAAGNLASAPTFDVQTGMDTAAPEISQVRSQSATSGGTDDKVQAIISWKTNELSSTQILWDLGATRGDTFANETKTDANLTTNHIVVVTQFKPGTVYRYRVISADKFGNIATSPDYTILTPVKRQSIIQMIVNQFESIFGWVSKIGR